jgi:hypothetical protein
MDALRYLVALFLLLLTIGGTRAQEMLALFTPVTGTLNSGESSSWTFKASDGALLSFYAKATSGDLDPVLTITETGSGVVLSNDDYDYPDETDALLEAVTIPSTGTYTATLSSFGSTSGSYTFTMLAGFANLAQQETFSNSSQWETDNNALEIIIGDNRMALILTGPQQRGIATPTTDDRWGDFYAHVEVPELAGAQGWQIGLAARWQDAQNYYLYSLNNRGQWRFLVRSGGEERVIRDWSEHPAIIAGQSAFSLGMLVNGAGFDFFYNGQPVGRLSDQTINEPGQVALMVETEGTLDSEVTAQFQNLTITTPLEDGLIPQQIMSAGSSAMMQELQRRRLVPTSGQMRLVVPESFVTYNRPGVNILPLGGSQTFRTFALGTTVNWEIATPGLPAGCGLILRGSGETEYLLAYFDQNGAYGLSQRQGDHFEPGIFGEGLTVSTGPQRLLVIATETQLLYYINGQLVGTLDSPVSEGGIGNAAINFEPTTTSCQFSDTWVWTWD